MVREKYENVFPTENVAYDSRTGRVNIQKRERLAMGDLKNAKLIYAKGFLFLLSGVIAASLVLVEMPTLKITLLLAISIWCFCRAYYFAFYVIEHYVDGDYKFAGLGSFVRYLFWK